MTKKEEEEVEGKQNEMELRKKDSTALQRVVNLLLWTASVNAANTQPTEHTDERMNEQTKERTLYTTTYIRTYDDCP